MHIQSLLVPAILAIGACAGPSRECEQWSNAENQVMTCYWSACGKNPEFDVGHSDGKGNTILSTTRHYTADAQCSSRVTRYRNSPSSDCCDAFGQNLYTAGCWVGWSDLWCHAKK
ncbi:unnamed protein product [Penicillium camemberti]|uniref:Str. FM013 n=1 Tax=Penicillium camemberti (strain FM 013) TaxID=1429867 RepID=A0A0G4P1M1_PENC3|nr:unnamed protein product [Penicillium camemberti]